MAFKRAWERVWPRKLLYSPLIAEDTLETVEERVSAIPESFSNHSYLLLLAQVGKNWNGFTYVHSSLEASGHVDITNHIRLADCMFDIRWELITSRFSEKLTTKITGPKSTEISLTCNLKIEIRLTLKSSTKTYHWSRWDARHCIPFGIFRNSVSLRSRR